MNALLKYGAAILGAVVVVVAIAAISSAVFSGSEVHEIVAERPATAAPKATPAPAPATAPAPAAVAAAPAPAPAPAPALVAPALAPADTMAAAPAPTPAPAPPLAADAPAAVAAAPAPAVPVAAAAGDIGPRLAAANAAAGLTLRVRCQTCHTFDNGGANRVGPNLWNVVGRDKGNVAGFMYSEAMKVAPGNWTYAELDAFLTAPAKHTPGTRMAFAGIASATDRANLIGHLRSLSTSPLPLP